MEERTEFNEFTYVPACTRCVVFLQAKQFNELVNIDSTRLWRRQGDLSAYLLRAASSRTLLPAFHNKSDVYPSQKKSDVYW